MSAATLALWGVGVAFGDNPLGNVAVLGAGGIAAGLIYVASGRIRRA
jgi:hypothetical protein